jgi:antitoxin HicB
MEYPAKFVHDRKAGAFVVSFPDVPKAHTQGNTCEEATALAAEALELALTFYTEQWKDLPEATAPKRGMRMIAVPALSAAKFKLYSILRASGVKRVELARRLGCAPSQVDRLLDIRHASRLARLEAAFAALGKTLSIEIRNRAA